MIQLSTLLFINNADIFHHVTGNHLTSFTIHCSCVIDCCWRKILTSGTKAGKMVDKIHGTPNIIIPLTVMSIICGVIGLVAPFLVPKGPNRG